ncbi:MAG: DUF5819 family protein [Bacteroidota bacterium]
MKKIIVGIFILHFSIVTVSVMGNIHVIPDGVVRDVANLYTIPFFEQNWGMFSNPPTTTKKVYFQYHVPDYTSLDREIEISEWYDVNSSIYKYNKSHLFSVAQRLIKFESSCLNSIFQVIEKCKDPTPEICIEYAPGFIALRNYAKIIYTNSTGIDVDEFSEIKFVIKVVEEHFPSFENRDLDYFDKGNYEYATFTSIPYALK